MRPNLAMALLVGLIAAAGCTTARYTLRDADGAPWADVESAKDAPNAANARASGAAVQTVVAVPTPPAPRMVGKPAEQRAEGKLASNDASGSVGAALDESSSAGASAFGCDEKNLHWLRGRITRIHIGRERFWQIRYAPLDRQDKYGGRFILEGYVNDDFHDGDLVYVEGRILSEPKDAKAGRYRCHSMSIVKPGNDAAGK